MDVLAERAHDEYLMSLPEHDTHKPIPSPVGSAAAAAAEYLSSKCPAPPRCAQPWCANASTVICEYATCPQLSKARAA
jgi:hypothetical protein